MMGVFPTEISDPNRLIVPINQQIHHYLEAFNCKSASTQLQSSYLLHLFIYLIKMVSRKAVKITGAALAVTAIAIGLGIGLGRKKNETTKQLSASQASGWNAYCGRRLDGTGRLFKAPTNNVRGEERKLGKEFIVSTRLVNNIFFTNQRKRNSHKCIPRSSSP